MRASRFAEAVKTANEGIDAQIKNVDEARYLKSLALYHLKQYSDAVQTANRLIAGQPNSVWMRKAKFLKAQSLIQQGKFQEAETIYEAEAFRLLSGTRKHKIASVLVRFADTLATPPDANDVGAPPPNYKKASNLYKTTLGLEIGRDLRDDVMYKLATASLKSGNHGQAINDFRAYLQMFDPDWTGAVGSAERMRGQKRTNPSPAGKHTFQARYQLARSQLLSNQFGAARQNFEDLLTLLDSVILKHAPPEHQQLRADTRWQIVRTYNMPQAAANELEKAIKSARTFLSLYASHPHSVEAAWLIAQSYQQHGRSDQAVAAYEDFLAEKNYELPAGDEALVPLERLKKSPAELKAQWQKQAVFAIAQIRFAQKQYAQAVEQWQRYVNRFPNGPQWAQAQRQIIDAEFQIALDAVADEKHDDARQLFQQFLHAHPLDARAARVQFILGQMDASIAEKLYEDAGTKRVGQAEIPEDVARVSFTKAIREWEQLVSKYPNTEESSLALYRIGLIYEEKLGQLENALDAYRRLTWGSSAPKARQRIAIMTQKHLGLRTEQKFRTNEQAHVSVDVRNIEKLTVRQYYLDLETYFRKTHSIHGVDGLDIALIQPAKTWDVTIEAYAKYKPIRQTIDIPFEKDGCGVCLIEVSEADLEATTLVIRSDLDLILRSSRREVLVYVQDMKTNRPAKDVRVLVSDGKTVFATGQTAGDGVFRKQFEELKTANSVRVFAVKDGNVASNLLNLSGLKISKGLARKGYLYTDRPAYQPGQTVNVRGIIRDVKDGSYRAPVGEIYVVGVTDARGRLLRQEDVTLSKFGTFHTSFKLDSAAPVGQYIVTARHKKETGATYSGRFSVQQFQLEKMRLRFQFPRNVYFRGEKVTATLNAEFYWGEPVAHKSIRYTLPDGRSVAEKTDANGVVKIEFDTSGVTPGRMLQFTAQIEGENVSVQGTVYLPPFGFHITVRPSQNLVLAGEPFDVTITTTAPDGKPVGKKLTLFVLRHSTSKSDPVLSQVPWIQRPNRPSAEVTVEEHAVRTKAQTGQATVRLTLKAGGDYVLRVAGEDRFHQTVTAQNAVTVSDETDATRLRLFAKTDTLKVGSEATVRLHTRLDRAVALLTWEGETILAHRVVPIKKGYNPIHFAVAHEHFPNFRVAVSTMDGRNLRTTGKTFRVERELRVTVKPRHDTYAPGDDGQIELTATDQLGRPVEAELSLAVIDEALFAIFPSQTPNIREFFQRDAKRSVEFRAAATNGFQYTAQTRNVIKAVVEEGERLERAKQEAKELAEMRDGRIRSMPLGAKRRLSLEEDESGLDALTSEMAIDKKASKLGGGGFGDAGERPMSSSRRAGQMLNGNRLMARLGPQLDKAKDDEGERSLPRVELPAAGRWFGSVVTDKNGKAVVTVPMPETTSQWRCTARGVSVKTLVGQATANVVTRKEFFVEIKSPSSAREGDRLRILTRIHNLTDDSGPVELTLTVSSGPKQFARLTQRTEVKEHQTTECLFDAVDVPAVGELELVVTATAGSHHDALSRSITIRPWGQEYAIHGGGTATNDAALNLRLPDGLAYSSKWLTIGIGPSVQQQVIAMALESGQPIPLPVESRVRPIHPRRPAPVGRTAGSELLAAVSGLDYAQAVQAADVDRQRLRERVRSLVSTLVVTQRDDGGWSWRGTNASRWDVSSVSYWALVRARELGITIHAETLKQAANYLLNMFRGLSANDHDAKSVILHALSVDQAADFKLVNTLYRERQVLSPSALAYTALTFANLDRVEFARELLTILDTKTQQEKDGSRVLCYWDAGTRYPWLNDQTETTAVTLLAFLKVQPTSPRIRQAVEFLMDRRGCFGWRPARTRGPAVAALAQYFQKGQFATTDFRLTVLVNSTPVKTVTRQGQVKHLLIDVPAKLIHDGANSIRFHLEGRGEYTYAATLRGFSSQFKDPKSWRYPYVGKRSYYHAPLEYRDRSINVASTSPVKNIEIGQRIRVHVDLWNSAYNGYLVLEEPIPAGTQLVAGSLKCNARVHEVSDGKIVMYFRPGQAVGDYSYTLFGYSTGHYRVPPPVLRDAMNPGRMRMGSLAELDVLASGQTSSDPYRMNDAERLALGTLYFNDGLYQPALEHLRPLFDREQKYAERDVARMLLWIHTAREFYDAQRVVKTFEVLTVRHPDLTIPFDKILIVGQAYRDIGEFERAWLVYRATIDQSFLSDSGLSAILQDEGQLFGSIDYQHNLWWEYPDTADVASSYFALSQLLYENAAKAHELAKPQRPITIEVPGQDDRPAERKPTRIDMLAEAIRLLSRFLTLYPTSPLADDASFSMANAYLDVKDYDAVVTLSESFKQRYVKSEFASSFQYMIALGHFWKSQYAPALAAARVVADGKSKDRDFARYILGQIYHAQGKPADAITWYATVRDQYADAREAIKYFERKSIALDEITSVHPGQPVELTLRYRNITDADVQVYKVDLMKLYLREKNLSRIAQVNLTGIEPELVQQIPLGDGHDYVDKKKTIQLDLKDEGAYLVISRGENLFASGLVLITPLKIEVQEDATSGRVRVNVFDEIEQMRPAGVHVKAIGSANSTFRGGETDLRGLFVADGLQGQVTIIARSGEARYAFYRGTGWLGAPLQAAGAVSAKTASQKAPVVDYLDNLRGQNTLMQQKSNTDWDQLRRSGTQGVQIQQTR